MAEYESFIGKKCYANDFNNLTQQQRNALASRGISKVNIIASQGGEVHHHGINTLIKRAYETLNYSSFISEVTEGMLAKHEYLECISQSISDLNNLLRCRSGCTGNCHSSCTGACTSSCSGSNHHNGSCSYMTWFCSGDCNNYCAGGCSGSCEGTCGQGCNNYCVSSCKNSSISSANRLPGTMVSV